MHYELNPTKLNAAFRTAMCHSWYDTFGSCIDDDNIYCGMFFE